MVMCYSNIVNEHAATLFCIQPVKLHFWMDSITVLHTIIIFIITPCSHSKCQLYILLLICKVVSFLHQESKAVLGDFMPLVEHDCLKWSRDRYDAQKD